MCPTSGSNKGVVVLINSISLLMKYIHFVITLLVSSKRFLPCKVRYFLLVQGCEWDVVAWERGAHSKSEGVYFLC